MADQSSSLEILLISPMSESSLITKSINLRLWEYYKFPNYIHVHTPRLDDRVTFGPSSYLAMYEEFFHDGLQLSLHPFILIVLDLYWIILAQLAPNSFQILCSFLVICYMEFILGFLYSKHFDSLEASFSEGLVVH